MAKRVISLKNTLNFSSVTLNEENGDYQTAVDILHRVNEFDFTALGIIPFAGASLKWAYYAGAITDRFSRIITAPGRDIGGIVARSGRPLMFTSAFPEIDPREYTRYPVLFTEGLRSFCALPLARDGRIVGVLLMAFRSADEGHEAIYREAVASLHGRFCDMTLVEGDFMSFQEFDTSDYADALPPRSALSRVIHAQEEERRRISRELHDGIAQEMLTVSMQINAALLATSDDEGRTQLLESAVANVSNILDELHNLSVELRPAALDNLGLLAALKSQAQVYLRTYGARVFFNGNYQGERFDPSLETQVYRICQEAILNSCKYSGAETILVTLNVNGNWICARIQDFGQGFDTDAPVIRGSGCGLENMRERAELIDATLSINSGPKGTTVILIAPMALHPDATQKG